MGMGEQAGFYPTSSCYVMIIQKEDRQEYIAALRTIRMEGTDEHLIAFFFKAATKQMEYALAQKKQNSRTMFFF